MKTTGEVGAVTLLDRAREIDKISAAAMEVFGSPETFEKELVVAQAVSDLRAALTPEVMKPVMALMNTSLGFRTDRDPATWSKPEPCIPYSEAVIREVFIESRLRGFHTVGNEFNVIAGRFYGALAGFERQVKKHPAVTDFRDWFDVPRMAVEKGALVKCKAEWRQEGTQQLLEREFAVRVNSGMGADAIVGKAKRKLYAAVLARLTGRVTPEGEADEVINVQSTALAVPAAPAALFGKNAAATSTPQPAGAEIHQSPATPESDDAPGASSAKTKTTVPPAAAPAASSEPTPKEELEHLLVSSGVAFDDFRDFVKIKNLAKDPESWASFGDVPEKVCLWFKNNPKTAAELVRKFGKVQGKS